MSIKSMLAAKAERDRLKESFDVTITPMLADKGPRYRVSVSKDNVLLIDRNGNAIQAHPKNGQLAGKMHWDVETKYEAKVEAKRAIDKYIRNTRHIQQSTTTMKVER